MPELSYNIKAKCSGCIALKHKDGGYTCGFDLPIRFNTVAGDATQPAPDNVKCYKPKTTSDLKKAQALMEAKIKVGA